MENLKVYSFIYDNIMAIINGLNGAFGSESIFNQLLFNNITIGSFLAQSITIILLFYITYIWFKLLYLIFKPLFYYFKKVL